MMTPKEKAIEIVDKFKPFAYTNVFSFREESNFSNSKKSAEVAVSLIITEYTSNICESGYSNDWEMWGAQRDYWINVRNEIKKLTWAIQ